MAKILLGNSQNMVYIRSVLGPLIFLVYINDVPENIRPTCKIFADDTSLFSHVLDKDTSQDELNYGLQKVSDWAFQWKMKFNPDPKNQAQEVIFFMRAESKNCLPLTFNKTEVRTRQSQKHLGRILDERLDFTEHINSKISKWDKLIGIIKNCLLAFQGMHY